MEYNTLDIVNFYRKTINWIKTFKKIQAKVRDFASLPGILFTNKIIMSMEFVFVTVLFTIVILVFMFLYFRSKDNRYQVIISEKQIIEYANKQMSQDEMLRIGLRLVNIISMDKISPWLKDAFKEAIRLKHEELNKMNECPECGNKAIH